MPSPLVAFRDVSVVRSGRTALSVERLAIDSGECVAILGPNGSGKSTLVKLVVGDLRAYAGKGQVTIQGRERWNLFELRSVLGIVSNDLQTDLQPVASGFDLVLSGFFGSYGEVDKKQVTRDMEDRANEALALVEAAHLRNRTYGELSSGEARRIMIARALAHRPASLLLDEPTTSLDLKATAEFHDLTSRLAQTGIGIILVTHHLEDIVPEITRVVLLKRGQVIADGPRGEVLTAESLSNLFEFEIQPNQHVRS
jgi:iron complex transport system ATP-binding protein